MGDSLERGLAAFGWLMMIGAGIGALAGLFDLWVPSLAGFAAPIYLMKKRIGRFNDPRTGGWHSFGRAMDFLVIAGVSALFGFILGDSSLGFFGTTFCGALGYPLVLLMLYV
ncbi:MAG: hypothetical protein NXI24_24685 [bacterium]|nr:hypothetical protein [bacterium]